MNNIKLKSNDIILAKLHSTDDQEVLNTIANLYENGNVAYIPSLIELLHATKNDSIHTAIVKLLSQIKQTEAIAMLIEALVNKRYQNIQQQLLGICWESGLDFSDHLLLFIDHILSSEFMVAFEALTVIENLPEKIDKDIRDQGLNKLIASLKDADKSRKAWIEDLIDLLPRMDAK